MTRGDVKEQWRCGQGQLALALGANSAAIGGGAVPTCDRRGALWRVDSLIPEDLEAQEEEEKSRLATGGGGGSGEEEPDGSLSGPLHHCAG